MLNISGFLLCIFSFATAALADTENIYCGAGSDSFSVAGAQIALVAQDRHPKLFLEGKDVTAAYHMTSNARGYTALLKINSPENPGPSFYFAHCGSDNVTSAHFIGGMVSNEPFPCSCETE